MPKKTPPELTEKMAEALRAFTKDWWHYFGAYKVCNACGEQAAPGYKLDTIKHEPDCKYIAAKKAVAEYDECVAKQKAEEKERQKLYVDGYEDIRFCDHCDEDTPHHCIDSDHERDSSGMQETCKRCGWWKTGMSSEQRPPF